MPLMDRVDSFIRRHPSTIISPPYNTLDGMWKVIAPDSPPQSFRRGVEMMTALEQRYDAPPGAERGCP